MEQKIIVVVTQTYMITLASRVSKPMLSHAGTLMVSELKVVAFLLGCYVNEPLTSIIEYLVVS